MSPGFLITALVVVLAPGTGVIYTVGTGLSQGRRASFAAAAGCTFGIVPHLLAAILGLSAILHTSAVVFQSVKFAGVAYLLYLAWQTLKSGGALSFDRTPRATSGVRIAIRGSLINILNPKLSMFFLAFLPQFLSGSHETATREMLELSGVFMALTFVIFVGYGIFASAARHRVLESPRFMRWIRRGFATAFAALGLILALQHSD